MVRYARACGSRHASSRNALTGSDYATQLQASLTQPLIPQALHADPRVDHRPQYGDGHVVREAYSEQHREGDSDLHYLRQTANRGIVKRRNER